MIIKKATRPDGYFQGQEVTIAIFFDEEEDVVKCHLYTTKPWDRTLLEKWLMKLFLRRYLRNNPDKRLADLELIMHHILGLFEKKMEEVEDWEKKDYEKWANSEFIKAMNFFEDWTKDMRQSASEEETKDKSRLRIKNILNDESKD